MLSATARTLSSVAVHSPMIRGLKGEERQEFDRLHAEVAVHSPMIRGLKVHLLAVPGPGVPRCSPLPDD